jgi:hypothetical protein
MTGLPPLEGAAQLTCAEPSPAVAVTLVGASGTLGGLKMSELVAEPPTVVTVIGPLGAPVGTVAVICMSESTLNEEAGPPPNPTPMTSVKLDPVMVTLVPSPPDWGLKPEIVGRFS